MDEPRGRARSHAEAQCGAGRCWARPAHAPGHTRPAVSPRRERCDARFAWRARAEPATPRARLSNAAGIVQYARTLRDQVVHEHLGAAEGLLLFFGHGCKSDVGDFLAGDKRAAAKQTIKIRCARLLAASVGGWRAWGWRFLGRGDQRATREPSTRAEHTWAAQSRARHVNALPDCTASSTERSACTPHDTALGALAFDRSILADVALERERLGRARRRAAAPGRGRGRRAQRRRRPAGLGRAAVPQVRQLDVFAARRRRRRGTAPLLGVPPALVLQPPLPGVCCACAFARVLLHSRRSPSSHAAL